MHNGAFYRESAHTTQLTKRCSDNVVVTKNILTKRYRKRYNNVNLDVFFTF